MHLINQYSSFYLMLLIFSEYKNQRRNRNRSVYQKLRDDKIKMWKCNSAISMCLFGADEYPS